MVNIQLSHKVHLCQIHNIATLNCTSNLPSCQLINFMCEEIKTFEWYQVGKLYLTAKWRLTQPQLIFTFNIQNPVEIYA